MRGSGYAVGEILIFLAIAGIIGFLVGWVVFYRRSDRSVLGEHAHSNRKKHRH